ncbi:MAG: DUF1329 domain-containing protein [Candidatus Binatus sp.]|uniref:DUF1329 domain-containing protein n=1 Tax=Candidatus Binatus sp. TaxID=2811406 RepID=UPI003C71E107
MKMTYNRIVTVLLLAFALCGIEAGAGNAGVKPGDVITARDAWKVVDLVSPGNWYLVRQGMVMKIVPTGNLEWPPPYRIATEKYSSQVSLSPKGAIKSYRAGLPFPVIDFNDPQAATKIMWNFEFRPLYTDDLDVRNFEMVSHRPGSKTAVEDFVIGHLGFYKNVGRVEVPPVPLNSDVYEIGTAYRGGIFPILDPPEIRGAGLIRQGSVLPGVEDAAWEYSPRTRRLRRLPATELADAFGVPTYGSSGPKGGGAAGVSTFASTIDPDSTFGFAAKANDYNYRLLGEKNMLASVEAQNIPAIPCANDGDRSVCPENWEMRHLYVIEATVKPRSMLGGQVDIPKRIFYIDSEGWFITAADLFNPRGELWKTIATFNAYRDRAAPGARVAIWPFKRMFQTAMVDEDLSSGFSTTAFTPRTDSKSECWYINNGVVDNAFFTTANMVQMAR